MKISTLFLFLVLIFPVAASAKRGPHSLPVEALAYLSADKSIRTELYFGLTKPDK
jgi:hypothetical protein